MPRHSQAKLTKARLRLAERVDNKCQNCGQHIAYPTQTNFPHWRSRNHMTVEEIYTEFGFTCEALHIYEHTLANNLKDHPCVKLFIQKYGLNKKFWQEFRNDRLNRETE